LSCGDVTVNKTRIRAWVAKLNAMLPLG
jgi:hypothetical protein